MVAQRKSVLDFVRGDFKNLQGKVSKDDQVRLDKHQELLADLDRRGARPIFEQRPA